MSRDRAFPTQPNDAGSPPLGEPAFLAVGKLRHPHGVHGEILMEVFTDFPERLKPGIVLYIGEETMQLRLVKCRQHREGLLMTFEGYTTPEDIGRFRNHIVYVKSVDCPPLGDGEYYHHQLVGLHVVTDGGKIIGTVSEILETGASDVLVILPESGPEILIPVVDSFIHGIDLDRRVITVKLIPGLLREEAES
jgi:16S rRNA processing protein RimM